MGMVPQWETAWQRAKRETIAYFGTIRFWIFDALITAGFTIWVLNWTPHFNQEWQRIVYQVTIPILGAISGLALVFLISLFVAPYKQRDEARVIVAHLKDTKVHISNKDTLIRAISNFKASALITFIGQKVMAERGGPDCPRECLAEWDAFDDAIKALYAEKLVAGERIDNLVTSLMAFVLTHINNSLDPDRDKVKLLDEDKFTSELGRKTDKLIRQINKLSLKD